MKPKFWANAKPQKSFFFSSEIQNWNWTGKKDVEYGVQLSVSSFHIKDGKDTEDTQKKFFVRKIAFRLNCILTSELFGIQMPASALLLLQVIRFFLFVIALITFPCEL